jgi:hypothetical protein
MTVDEITILHLSFCGRLLSRLDAEAIAGEAGLNPTETSTSASAELKR